jgi:predicted TIM-barrel fold metal-dependent hydrolase
VGEIVFPDGAPFGAGGLGSARTRFPREQEFAGAQAYNRWLIDYLEPHPERFAGQAIVPLHDIPKAIKEVHWAAEHGLKGVVMPGMDNDLPYFWDECYEPFWSACAETGLLLNFHGGIGQPDYGGAYLPGVPDVVRMRVSQFEFPWFAHRPLWFLIWAGVFERHPNLRVVFTEQHTDWVIRDIARMDHSWHNSMMEDSIKKIVPRPPSEYFREQVYLGCSVMSQGEVLSRDQIGLDRMMYGADFPHPEGTWGMNLTYLRATVGRAEMSADETADFLYRNAARIWGFDLGVIEPLVEKHGWSVEDVNDPLPLDAEASLKRKDALRPTVQLTPIRRG